MFPWFELADSAKAVMPLLPGVIKVIEKLSDQKEDPTLTRVVAQLRVDTLEGAQQLRAELIAILQDKSMDSQLEIQIKKLGDDLSWLRDPVKKRRVQKCRDRINEIHQNLTSSTDDLASVLACMQRLEGMGDVYAAAQGTRADLDGLLSSEPSLRKVVETYIKFLDTYIVRLHS